MLYTNYGMLEYNCKVVANLLQQHLNYRQLYYYILN